MLSHVVFSMRFLCAFALIFTCMCQKINTEKAEVNEIICSFTCKLHFTFEFPASSHSFYDCIWYFIGCSSCFSCFTSKRKTQKRLIKTNAIDDQSNNSKFIEFFLCVYERFTTFAPNFR